MKLCTHVQGQLDWIIRHLVWLVRGNRHYYLIHLVLPLVSKLRGTRAR